MLAAEPAERKTWTNTKATGDREGGTDGIIHICNFKISNYNTSNTYGRRKHGNECV